MGMGILRIFGTICDNTILAPKGWKDVMGIECDIVSTYSTCEEMDAPDLL